MKQQEVCYGGERERKKLLNKKNQKVLGNGRRKSEQRCGHNKKLLKNLLTAMDMQKC